MEKRKDTPVQHSRRGLMESLLRRRDPDGDLAFAPEGDENEEFYEDGRE